MRDNFKFITKGKNIALERFVSPNATVPCALAVADPCESRDEAAQAARCDPPSRTLAELPAPLLGQ